MERVYRHDANRGYTGFKRNEGIHEAKESNPTRPIANTAVATEMTTVIGRNPVSLASLRTMGASDLPNSAADFPLYQGVQVNSLPANPSSQDFGHR